MVWFQCEACGEDLKKPKLPNHFRSCPAYKLSCIDCGETFDKQSVQFHTQCITEAEKYGPKGQGKVANGTPAKPNKDKLKPDVDINVGLSERPPWFCSLCNTQATSKQALLLHADGKKHRAKSRAYAAKQQPSQEAAPENKDSTKNNPNNEVPNDKSSEDRKENVPLNGSSVHDTSLAEDGNASAEKKRKIDVSNDDGSTEKCLNRLGNGNATQAEVQGKPKKMKKTNHEPELKGAGNKKTECEAKKVDEGAAAGASKETHIKWKKLITSVLKSTPDGALKMKKLRKLVLKSLRESGFAVDDSEFCTILEHKVNSSSKFTVDGKYVKLAA